MATSKTTTKKSPKTKITSPKTTTSKSKVTILTKSSSTHLVIVESPAKCATIGKYLGPNYTVMASYGHIVELEKKNMGIDTDNGYTPHYQIDDDKKRVVSALKSAMKKVDQVWIATDEDREGEAIGRHVANALWLPVETTPRITFNEITKPALEHAIANPRTLDMDLINAQQARRVLDRLVWFELSPLLRKKINAWLSAGRVQSVAVRLIVDREKEIQGFVPTPILQSTALFSTPKGDFVAKWDVNYTILDDAKNFLTSASEGSFSVSSVVAKPAKKSPSAPFTTSTLQQEASRKLWFSVGTTMRVAQKLYESGLITYMRTDSIAMSWTAISNATKEISSRFGEEMVQVRKFVNKNSSAQEAHECIRPTHFENDSAGHDSAEQKLYRLIWQRAVASQMTDAQLEKTIVKIALSSSSTGMTATGEVIVSPGFLSVYGIDIKTKLSLSEDDDDEENISNQWLPPLVVGQVLELQKMTVLTSYDRYPPRYTEASLVKKLEAEGIGRPSTYAPTISTILKRWYVILEDREWELKDFHKLELVSPSYGKNTTKEKIGNYYFDEQIIKKAYWAEKKKLFPTDIGTVVTDFLTDHFSDIVDYGFTAKVEQELDEIAIGKRDRRAMMDVFYKPFHTSIVRAWGEAQRATGERILGIDAKSGKSISVRLWRFGPFVQRGNTDDTEKSYASLKPGLRLDTITLEQALSCFDLPRNLGQYNDTDMIVSIGRFGPYIKYGSLFVSLRKQDDPYTIDAQTAQELIEAKINADANKLITTFVYNATECKVENGRYGPFIRYGKLNIKIPKDILPKIQKLSDQERVQIVQAWEWAVAAPKKSRGRKK